ncbi:MAG: Fe-S cluster assembly protein SufD, partial [Saprospiraceae bacterium]|nr:Fe-S cluster assembly protein SufD [Saprospiraceae bacterium]
AFAQGMVFHIEKNVALKLPVQLIYETNIPEENMMTAHLNLFFIETGAKCNVVEVALGLSTQTAYFQNIYNRIYVHQNAHISMHRWQEEGSQGNIINTTEVKQSKGSTFSNLNIDIGGKLVRNNVYATHLGEQVSTNLYGAYIASGERQHIDNQTFIDHAKPHCLSNELYKGIVDNYSTAVFNGKVIVRPDAQKINAFQQNASLLLSDEARVDSKPQLEIFADDVRCSHGATIGQLDEQALYYLMTRGLPKREAKKMLQTAFIAEVFSDFGEGQIVDSFSEKLQQYL